MKTITAIEGVAEGSRFKTNSGRAILEIAGKFWFITAVTGQWIFAYYVAVFYGGSALKGNLSEWDKVLPHGMIDGDNMGNVALAGHLFLAVVIMIGGPLQFIPQIRKYALSFHRWNGRIYIPIVFITSLFGLYMIWTRGTTGGLIMHLGTSFNAVLIMIFSVLAWRFAMIRKFDLHRRWAMRLFIVVSGVWFFRVGLMLWLLIHGGPVGFNMDTFEGPFLSFWAFGQYLVPLAILELYFMSQNGTKPVGRFAMAISLIIITLAMGVGIFGATMGMWLPRI